MKCGVRRWLLMSAGIAALSWPGLAEAATQNRIVDTIDNARVAAMRGNVHRLARPQFDEGRVEGSLRLPRVVLTFRMTPGQQSDLDALLRAQMDPASPNYHRWLTPEEYAGRFGLGEADLAQVVNWLRAQALTVVEIARGRNYVTFQGSAAQVEAALRTEIHRYRVEGELHYANAGEPSLPAALAGVVLGVRGLHDFRLKPKGIARARRPRFTSSVSGYTYLAPDDFATIYNVKPLYASGIDGSGQTIAVMGQTDLILSDIATFRRVSGLSATLPQVVLVPGALDPGISAYDIDEANLDLEWAGGIARNAALVYVNSFDVFDSLQYAIDQNLAPVITISYGDCEQNFAASDLATLVTNTQRANAQGITVVGPSGDTGAADCDYNVTEARFGLAVDIPAALPYVTAVGERNSTKVRAPTGTPGTTAIRDRRVRISRRSPGTTRRWSFP